MDAKLAQKIAQKLAAQASKEQHVDIGTDTANAFGDLAAVPGKVSASIDDFFGQPRAKAVKYISDNLGKQLDMQGSVTGEPDLKFRGHVADTVNTMTPDYLDLVPGPHEVTSAMGIAKPGMAADIVERRLGKGVRLVEDKVAVPKFNYELEKTAEAAAEKQASNLKLNAAEQYAIDKNNSLQRPTVSLAPQIGAAPELAKPKTAAVPLTLNDFHIVGQYK